MKPHAGDIQTTPGDAASGSQISVWGTRYQREVHRVVISDEDHGSRRRLIRSEDLHGLQLIRGEPVIAGSTKPTLGAVSEQATSPLD